MSAQSRRPRERGQILPLFALGLITLLSGVALVVDGGNAFAQQRTAQNGADAAANAGAVVLAQRLGGVSKTDTDVADAVSAIAGLDGIAPSAYYTDVSGNPIDGSGTVVAADAAATVGGGTLPDGAQGVHVTGRRTFDTFIARVIGINTFTAAADAIAVTGNVIGGQFLPVVFPINITDCSGNGNLGTGIANWDLSDPSDTPGGHPVARDTNGDGVAAGEYIVPLCKTGGGSFMILDLDPNKTCAEEVTDPPHIQWNSFPVDVPSDNGNDCAKKMLDPINALSWTQPGTHPVLVPICDSQEGTGTCNTSGGSNATYHVTRVASFVIDYISDSNNKNNSLCQSHTVADPTEPGGMRTLTTISGNGSSSCIAGWFVKYITVGPVCTDPDCSVEPTDAIGIQLIK